MKRIAIVTDSGKTRLGETLRRNLEEVLEGRADIQAYTFESLSPREPIPADLVLVMLKSKTLGLKDHVTEDQRILAVRRTIREREIYPIFTIPAGTRVLVVNDHPETTLEMVALLRQLEINHLQFIPYLEGTDCRDIRIAITPGERAKVPPHIETVIDLGHRCLDISTFIEIINGLQITDAEVDRRLFRYSEGIVPLDTGIDRHYKALYLKHKELDTVLNLAHEGILLLDSEGKVALHNRALAGMLDLQEDIIGTPVSAFGPELREVLGDKQREWIVDFRGRSLVVTRQAIEHFGEPAGSCFNFQEVTYIRQLEQNLSRKLRGKGHTARYRFSDVQTRSPRMLQCVELARRIAASEFTVLILGESGTGKELLAQSIHSESARCKQPFVAVNCAAVPENLLESELFGYEGGSFTGALKEGKAGLFEQANHGTVFLDEVADMPLVLQAKLLRVLQERQVMRVGSQKLVDVNIRVIAATNHDLRERIRAGRFREDLYYRLNTLPLLVPPLRERPEDIFLLLEHFLARHKRKNLSFSPEARELLLRYPWPGNIRELANVASYLSFLSGRQVTPETLPYYLLDGAPADPELDPKARAVLVALAGGTAGRKALEGIVSAQGLTLTEGEIRGLLRFLGEAGLVHSRTGRSGSGLTAKGQSYLNRLTNRSI